jgi:hypothetical protein
MKRDLDLVRTILFRIQNAPPDQRLADIAVEGHDPRTVSEHVRMLIAAGLLDGAMYDVMGDEPTEFSVDRLTWDGHEYLDSVQNDTVWASVKASAKEKGLTLSFDVAKALALAKMRVLLGLPPA